MSAFSATYTAPVVEDWESGDVPPAAKWRDAIFQNIVYLKAQTDSITANVQKRIWYYGAAGGS